MVFTPRRSVLAARLGDDLLRDVPRNLGVGVELHGEDGASLSLAPQVTDVSEHLGQWHGGLDDLDSVTLAHLLNLATTAVQVADDVTHVVLRSGDLDGHHRLQQRGVGLAGRLLERHGTGELERQLRGVDAVAGAVLQSDLDADQRVSGEHAELGRLLAARVDRRDVLPRDAATGDLVLELVAVAAAAERFDVDDDAAELARATRLLLVGVLDLLHLAANGLTVGDLRPADVRLDLALTLHAVDQHLEVQLAHAGDDGLPGLLVGPHLEGGVLLGEPLDRGA